MKAMRRNLGLYPNQALRLSLPLHLDQIKHRTPTRSAAW